MFKKKNDITSPGISKLDAENIFKIVAKRMYGQEIDFSPIIEDLSKLKTGGRLTYDHLLRISDEGIWPFKTWWRWPSREDIERQLDKTDRIFECLLDLPKEHEEREEIDSKLFNKLYYNIFKHIELVSIVLRFVDEENFAIYSPPLARILDHPRGYSYTSEYMNYVKELRKYRDIYKLDKVSQVDMFLWALEILGDERRGILELFHDRFEKDRKAAVVNRFMKKNVFKKNHFEKALFYLDVGAVDTAAKWAGCAFEDAVRNACNIQYISEYDEKGRRPLRTLVSMLCKERKEYDFSRLADVVKKRNKASHPSSDKFALDEVELMIETTQEVADISKRIQYN